MVSHERFVDQAFSCRLPSLFTCPDLIVIQTSQVSGQALVERQCPTDYPFCFKQGLSAYVKAHLYNATSRGVVIGHDHRHNSERWARLATAAFLADGVKVHFLRGVVHTPMYGFLLFVLVETLTHPRVPFSVKTLEAACGVMITGICVGFTRPTPQLTSSSKS